MAQLRTLSMRHDWRGVAAALMIVHRGARRGDVRAGRNSCSRKDSRSPGRRHALGAPVGSRSGMPAAAQCVPAVQARSRAMRPGRRRSAPPGPPPLGAAGPAPLGAAGPPRSAPPVRHRSAPPGRRRSMPAFGRDRLERRARVGADRRTIPLARRRRCTRSRTRFAPDQPKIHARLRGAPGGLTDWLIALSCSLNASSSARLRSSNSSSSRRRRSRSASNSSLQRR